MHLAAFTASFWSAFLAN